MNKLSSKVYFKIIDLKENESKEDKINEVKRKIKESLHDSFVKNKIQFEITEYDGCVEVEGTLNLDN